MAVANGGRSSDVIRILTSRKSSSSGPRAMSTTTGWAPSIPRDWPRTKFLPFYASRVSRGGGQRHLLPHSASPHLRDHGQELPAGVPLRGQGQPGDDPPREPGDGALSASFWTRWNRSARRGSSTGCCCSFPSGSRTSRATARIWPSCAKRSRGCGCGPSSAMRAGTAARCSTICGA